MKEQKGFFTKLGELIDEHLAGRRRDPAQQTRPQPGRLRRALRWLTPNGGTLLLIAALLLTQNVWARPDANPAAAPGPSATTVNYQGRLADPSGNPLDGTYGMSFSLWDASASGNLVWGPENHAAVPVSEGLFSVGLGSQTSGGIPTSVWNGDRYLEITVGGETLSPRELIRSVPIAGMALTVPDGAISSAVSIRTRGSSVSGATNLTMFSDLPGSGLSMNITTTGAQSILDCTFNGSAWLGHTSSDMGAVEFRLVLDNSIYGPSVDGFRFFFNERSAHRAFSWRWAFTNVTPGAHTIKVQWRSVWSDDWITIDDHDDFVLTVVELKK